jgi:HEAT repeat protein
MSASLRRVAAASSLLAVLFYATSSFTTENLTGKDKAWDILNSAVVSGAADRATAISVLGLLPDDPQALDLAKHALEDPDLHVRIAGCNALGNMHATSAIPDLQKALSDKEIAVVVAAAHALNQLKDSSAYDIYYAILTGKVKDNKGFVAKQLDTLKDPKEMAKIGFSEGIGFIPFAGAGWDAFRMLHKTDPTPVRAAAAQALATDPDPKTGEALVTATTDKNWIVRVAALEAICKRGEPALLPKIEAVMFDPKRKVRYTAAATVIRLSTIRAAHKPKPTAPKEPSKKKKLEKAPPTNPKRTPA